MQSVVTSWMFPMAKGGGGSGYILQSVVQPEILIGEAGFEIAFICGDCSIRVTALLGYLDFAIPVFCFLEMPEFLLIYGVAL